MVFAKYLLPALAATQVAFASSCGSTKVVTQADVPSCETINGDITIEKSAAGALDFSTVKQIDGSVIGESGNQVTGLTFDSLQSISKDFMLNNMTMLTDLSAPVLTAVQGEIKFEALPLLQSLRFSTGVTMAGSVTIINTGLTSLTGISLKSVGQFYIADNKAMRTCNINNLQKATGLISFTANSPFLSISLPNMVTGTNMTFSNIKGIAIPSLQKLTGQLAFRNVAFTSFAAPNLTETGDLVFSNNSALNNVTMPQLKKVNGGFTITRCDKLSTIVFPRLLKVTGAIDFSGMFDKVELPRLMDVQGGFNMQSTGNFSCSSFSQLRHNQYIHGKYTCKSSVAHPTTSNGQSGTATGSGSGSSASPTPSKDAAVVHAANVPVVGLAAVFGALVQFAL